MLGEDGVKEITFYPMKGEYLVFDQIAKGSKSIPFALFTNPPLAGAASLSFQHGDRECNCCLFFISTKFNGLIFNTEYAT